jgi:hypothetical protein
MMNIQIRDSQNRAWTRDVPDQMKEVFTGYKTRHNYYREAPYISGEYIVYRIDNDPYLPTYIAKIADIPRLDHNGNSAFGVNIGIPEEISIGQRNNLANNIIITREIHNVIHKTPIISMNDISVFIVDNRDMGRPNWLPCRDYQAWAFRDFMYDETSPIKKSYMSPHSSHLAFSSNIDNQNVVSIDLPGLPPNIIFNISRNDNNSIYYERNDTSNSRVRICDNEYARNGYLGFFTRLTMDLGMIVIPPVLSTTHHINILSTSHISAPEDTNDELKQCILCCKYKVNAKFSPCEHTICCSVCYSKLSVNKCPVCRADILRVMNI